MEIQIDKILPNPDQPRSQIDQSELEGLAQSLAEIGLLNPIAVEGPHEDGYYILVDGERRWRAAQIAGWKTIAGNVRPPNGSDHSRLLLAMIGNLRRADMAPIDEATGYKQLRAGGLSVEEISRQVGRSVQHVYMRLRLLELPGEVQELINNQRLPLDDRAVRALRELPAEQAVQVARTAAARGLSGQGIRTMCTRISKGKIRTGRRPRERQAVAADSECPALDYNPGLPQSWSWLNTAARRTCRGCGLYEDEGKNTICRECPLTVFFGKIAGSEEEK